MMAAGHRMKTISPATVGLCFGPNGGMVACFRPIKFGLEKRAEGARKAQCKKLALVGHGWAQPHGLACGFEWEPNHIGWLPVLRAARKQGPIKWASTKGSRSASLDVCGTRTQ
ncbi:hypothetical protein COP2_033559 [Malus domestica]